jgi:hypothetical protein
MNNLFAFTEMHDAKPLSADDFKRMKKPRVPKSSAVRWVCHRKSSQHGFIFQLERCEIGNRDGKNLMQRRRLILW